MPDRRAGMRRTWLVGLAVGADDYLTKPFSMREAGRPGCMPLLRAGRPIRRPPPEVVPTIPVEPPIVVGDLEINRTERRVRRGGGRGPTSPRPSLTCWSISPPSPSCVGPGAIAGPIFWGWADANGDAHRRQSREGVASKARRRPDPHGGTASGYALDGPAK